MTDASAHRAAPTPALPAAPTAAPTRAVILLRPRDRLPTARRRFHETAARLAAQLGLRVTAAYITPHIAGDRSLGDAVHHLAASGVREIAVVPYLVEFDHPDAYDVPDALYDLAQEFPHLTIRMAPPLGLANDLDPVVSARLHDAWSLPAIGPRQATVREIAAIAGQTPVTTASLPPGDLPTLPAHARHLFVCFGRRCMEEGSPEVHHLLVDLLADRGLATGPNHVKLTRTKCLSPCQAAPVAVTYPDGAFHCRLTPDLVPTFVDTVLVNRQDLPGHTFEPASPTRSP